MEIKENFLPDNQNEFDDDVVVDVLFKSDVVFQFDGEHDDFDGLLPFDG